MNGWKPTIGKWDDPENYDMKPPTWKRALYIAEEQYKNAEAVIHLKDKTIPFIEYVRNVMHILINEANCKWDDILTLCALCRVTERTGCSWNVLQQYCHTYQRAQISSFPMRRDEQIPAYLSKVFASTTDNDTLIVILAEILFELRMNKCPMEDWIADRAFYDDTDAALNDFIKVYKTGTILFLCEKIKEQIRDNRDVSRNTNKTAEELYCGWNE